MLQIFIFLFVQFLKVCYRICFSKLQRKRFSYLPGCVNLSNFAHQQPGQLRCNLMHCISNILSMWSLFLPLISLDRGMHYILD